MRILYLYILEMFKWSMSIDIYGSNVMVLAWNAFYSIFQRFYKFSPWYMMPAAFSFMFMLVVRLCKLWNKYPKLWQYLIGNVIMNSYEFSPFKSYSKLIWTNYIGTSVKLFDCTITKQWTKCLNGHTSMTDHVLNSEQKSSCASKCKFTCTITTIG